MFLAVASLASIFPLHAQNSRPATSDTIAELAPMIVTGSFELQQRPADIGLVIKDLELQFAQKGKAVEEVSRSPLWNARNWKYLPVHLAPTDSTGIRRNPIEDHFFTPSYLILSNQNSMRAVDLYQKRDLFEARVSN